MIPIDAIYRITQLPSNQQWWPLNYVHPFSERVIMDGVFRTLASSHPTNLSTLPSLRAGFYAEICEIQGLPLPK